MSALRLVIMHSMTGRAAAQPAEPPASADPGQPPGGRLLHHGWVGIAQLAAIAAIAAGAVAAIYAERGTIWEGLYALRYVRVGWLVAGSCAELVSMVALAQLERGLLRGIGARQTLRSVLGTAYTANAISVSVPVIGSGIATAHAYRDFRRAGSSPEHVSMALAVAGVFSSVAFAVVAAVGALITGNPAAAVIGLAGSVVLAAATAALFVALRFPRARGWLVARITAVLRVSRKYIQRPRDEPGPLVTTTLDRIAALRLGYLTAGGAFGWALINWMGDVACLVCAIKAVREPVPWATILIIWSAGIGAASFSPVPAGIGVVEVVLITALADAGLHGKYAIAAVLVYRIIALKVLISLGWIFYHYREGRRRAKQLSDR